MLVVAVGDEPPLLKQNDLLSQRDRREPVRNHEGSAPGHNFAQCGLDLLLG